MKASDHISNSPKENATSIDSDASLDVEKLQVSDEDASSFMIFVDFFFIKSSFAKASNFDVCSTLMHNNLLVIYRTR